MPKGLAYLNSLDMHAIKLGLERVQKLAQALNSPHNKFKSIHIAGTNGKGSTAAMLASVLRQSGLKVGLYTSPHLNRFNERIKINGKDITDAQLEKQIEMVRKAAEKKKLKPTYFEFTTAIAFNYFAEKKVDIAVLETGMGGRLDATNIVSPLLSIITSINFEHKHYLGDTLDKIASEKFGIVKNNSMVVSGVGQPALQLKLKKLCRQKNSGLMLTPGRFETELRKMSLDETVFSLVFDSQVLTNLSLPLPGRHQLNNAALVVAAASALRQQGFRITDAQIKNGLRKVKWPARFEVMQKKPLVVLESAHNPACFKVLKETLGIVLPDRNFILVFGLSPDKELEKIAPLVFPLAEKVFVCESKYKAMPAAKIKRAASKFVKQVEVVKDVKAAIKKALKSAKANEVVLVTGSIFVCGEARAIWKK